MCDSVVVSNLNGAWLPESAINAEQYSGLICCNSSPQEGKTQGVDLFGIALAIVFYATPVNTLP